jgi:hypothetical protein
MTENNKMIIFQVVGLFQKFVCTNHLFQDSENIDAFDRKIKQDWNLNCQSTTPSTYSQNCYQPSYLL